MLAATEAFDIGRMIVALALVLGIAKLAAELCERVNIPAVLGEIVAGIIIGPYALGLIDTSHVEVSSMLAVLGEIGVLLLLLQVGMEMDLAELGKVGKASMAVAVIGIAAPFAGGIGVTLLSGESTKASIFIGAALTATSVGITARVFGDLRALATTEARIVLGAAVADDVLGLIILTIVVKVVTDGSVSAGTIATTFLLAAGFLILTGVAGIKLIPAVLDFVNRMSRSPATLAVAAFALMLAFAALADVAKLAPIIGAFMAGLAFGRSNHRERLSRDFGAIGNLLIPVFFLQIGINADINAMARPSVLGLAALLMVVAVVGKLVSAFGAGGSRVDRLLIGIGMIPRGEVGLIFASIGLVNGVLTTDLYAALLIVVLLSTLVTPPLLRWRVGARSSEIVADDSLVTEVPADGWLSVDADLITLNGYPAGTEAIPLALQAAKLAIDARPSSALLDWFAAHRNESLVWDQQFTPALLELLRLSNARTWRLMEVTGVLERALPELATAIEHRRADHTELDLTRALRFPLVETLHETLASPRHDELFAAEYRLLDSPDDLTLAALALDVCGSAADSGACIRGLITRLTSETESAEISTLIDNAHLLRASSSVTDRFDEREIVHVAAHLQSRRAARESYLVAVLMGGLRVWQREALDELHGLVHDALSHPRLVGAAADTLAGARRDAARRLISSEQALARLDAAPNAYILSHDPGELARQIRLVEPVPSHGAVRVAVSPDERPDRWKVDVAGREQRGLLARLTKVLGQLGLDVHDASIATWDDGAVLDCFVVSAEHRPMAGELAEAFECALRETFVGEPMPYLEIDFDNAALPWHTACLVSGADQPGVLFALSSAFAAADVVVHSARVATSGRRVNDRFSVTDRLGRKLDPASQERVRRALAGDRVGRRFSRRRTVASR